MNLPASLIQSISALFERMDHAYDEAAAQSGFECRGCHDNCCLTRFYHHTLLEWVCLRSGMAALPPVQQALLRQRAREAIQQMAELDQHNQPVRVMCPLNEDERCLLYTQRPMICRLHGIPHQLHRPDGQIQTGPGCDAFYVQSEQAKGVLDRTPLYMDMAKLEREVRQTLGYQGKIRMTVAEMILEDGFKF